MVVGTWYDNDNGTNAGSAYIFEKVDGVWVEHQKLLASDGAKEDYFGRSIAIYGNTVVVCSHGDDDNGSASGATYIFER